MVVKHCKKLLTKMIKQSNLFIFWNYEDDIDDENYQDNKVA
jgi:septin family protein